MPGMPRGRSARVGRYRPWRRQAVLLRRGATGCYAAAVLLASLALAWSRSAWLAAAVALLGGFWCQRSATFAGQLEDRDEAKAKADVPGD
jgi:hypothetical protein